jgi:hypothetical protein
VTPGAGVWLGLAVAWLLWLAVTFAGSGLPTIVNVVRWFCGSWATRGLALGLWAYAGWHLFAQRP